MTEQTLADIDAQEQALKQQTAARAAELAQKRQALAREADQARREAARGRLTELNDQLIPANVARSTEAHAALRAIVEAGSDPLVEALTTILETHLATHALHVEASNMEGTLGLTTRPAPTQLPIDVLSLLSETVTAVATSRQPTRAPLPQPGTPTLTHEEQMAYERQTGHEDRLLYEFLRMTPGAVAALSPDARAAKLEEARAEKQKRQEEADRKELPSEKDAQFRRIWG